VNVSEMGATNDASQEWQSPPSNLSTLTPGDHNV